MCAHAHPVLRYSERGADGGQSSRRSRSAARGRGPHRHSATLRRKCRCRSAPSRCTASIGGLLSRVPGRPRKERSCRGGRMQRAEPPELKELARRHPLPGGFEPPECFVDRALLFGRTFHLVGFTSVSAAGETVTGSAADMGGAPIARAYFELLERACVLDAVERAASEYGLRDATGRALGTCPSDVVFPREPPGAGFRYSLSNGVAAGRTWTDASAAALAELVERDRVLRSWFGESRPEPVPLPPRSIFAELASAYELRAYRFPSPGEDRSATTKALTAVGVFGFPRSPNFPLVYGLAAANSPQQALFRAQRECLQRLA